MSPMSAEEMIEDELRLSPLPVKVGRQVNQSTNVRVRSNESKLGFHVDEPL